MPDNQKSLTYLNLPAASKRLGKMAAARCGVSLSAYIEHLIQVDAERNGLTHLVGNDKEVPNVCG